MGMHRYRRSKVGILRHTSWSCSVAALFVASPVWAADIYVDAAAAGGGDGSAGMPLQQIQDALQIAMPGDVVHVAPGTYAPIATVRDGADGMPISVVADQRRTALVQGAGDTTLANAHQWHTYQGLVFDGAYADADLVENGGGNHLSLIDVEIRRSGDDCIDLRNSSDILVEGSTIHHCVSFDTEQNEINDSHGITGDSVFDLTVRNSEFYQLTGDGVQMSPPREAWSRITIEGCTFRCEELDEETPHVAAGTKIGENALDTKVDSGTLDGSGNLPVVVVRDTVASGFGGSLGFTNQAAFLLKEDVDVTLDRVTISDGELGFRMRFPAVVRVQNAVVHDVEHVIRYEDGLTGAIFVNSTIGSGIAAEPFFDGGGGGQQGMVIQNLLVLGDAVPDPAPPDSNMAVGPEVFLDAAAHNYRLVEGSAPIDAGMELAEVTEDRDGVPRPYGDAYDIGAHEWNPDTGTTGDDGSDAGDTGADDGVDDGVDETAGTGASGSASEGGTATTAGSATTASSAGESGEGDAGAEGGDDGGGCNCTSGAAPRGSAVTLLLALVGLRRRR